MRQTSDLGDTDIGVTLVDDIGVNDSGAETSTSKLRDEMLYVRLGGVGEQIIRCVYPDEVKDKLETHGYKDRPCVAYMNDGGVEG
jgi:hypothetical protein